MSLQLSHFIIGQLNIFFSWKKSPRNVSTPSKGAHARGQKKLNAGKETQDYVVKELFSD